MGMAGLSCFQIGLLPIQPGNHFPERHRVLSAIGLAQIGSKINEKHVLAISSEIERARHGSISGLHNLMSKLTGTAEQILPVTPSNVT